MATPTRGEIEDEARKRYISDVASATGQEPTNPELDELKETGYYARARRSLMSTGHTEGETAGQQSAEVEQYHREPKFNTKSGRFAGFRRRVAPVRTVVMAPSRAIGSIRSSNTVSSIRSSRVAKRAGSSFRSYKASKQAEEAAKRKEAAEIRAVRLEEARFAYGKFEKGRQRGIGDTAYAAGRRVGKAYASRPPPPGPLTFRGVLELQGEHIRRTRIAPSEGLIPGLGVGDSILGSLGNESEFNYLSRGPAPKGRKQKQGNELGLWL